MFEKLKQIQDLRTQAKAIKSALSSETVQGVAAWEKIKITMDGNQEVKKVEIDPELLKDQNKLQEEIKNAINDAIGKVQKVMAKKMQEIGGLNIPGLK